MSDDWKKKKETYKAFTKRMLGLTDYEFNLIVYEQLVQPNKLHKALPDYGNDIAAAWEIMELEIMQGVEIFRTVTGWHSAWAPVTDSCPHCEAHSHEHISIGPVASPARLIGITALYESLRLLEASRD